MPHADFVHLRVRSAYSLSEGAIKIGELVALCRDAAMPAVAVTDRGNLFGALEFSEACRMGGVQPIIGCDLAIGTRDAEDERARRPDWLGLLVQNETGYGNLMALTSRAFLAGESGGLPLVTPDELAARADGLIALTGGPAGAVGRHLLAGQARAAHDALASLAAVFPGRLYVELMRHEMEDEARIEAGLIDLAYALDLPLVATNDAHFATPDMFEAHDALLCIADGSHIDDENRRRLTPQHCFRPADEMRALFADLPEAVDNTLVIARRCAYMAPARDPILPAFDVGEGGSEADALRTAARAGLEARLENAVFTPEMDDAARAEAATPYRERLEHELEIIISMKFPGYFLIVAEFIKWAKAQGIPVGPGRGSGAGSVVAWALTITDLDPLRFGLLFERFLNPERVSMPDFDIDFCQERRDDVIEHVCDKYGVDRVAQIITFGKLQARAALRDVGRVLGMPYGQVDRICKLVPYNPANPVSLGQAIDGEPRLQAMRAEEPIVDRLMTIALKLEGLYRHASTHAAGVVIGDQPLETLVPLYRDPRSEMPVTQFSMKYAELAGLVKFDFLGLKTLTVLENAVALVRDTGDIPDLLDLPLDDAKTFEMLGEGATVGVFQLESAGMRDALRSMKPDAFEDIIALVALYRPGPMDNIPKYIACKHGVEEPDYLHPSLRGILEETFGVIIYQEQVMQIAQVLAGYSLGSADLLRRAMGKKIKAEMDAQQETFVGGAVANGVSKADARRIFDLVAKFAGYGFNKSHAAAYALIAYQTGYLKANHPVEFLAASMNLELSNSDKLSVFRQELERLSIPLLPPDVNRSTETFSVELTEDGTKAIRYALGAIKNVGVAAMKAIVAERGDTPFDDVFDFAGRLDPQQINRRALENLARAGAFDSLNGNRHQVFEAAELLIRHAATLHRENDQASLFGADSQVLAPRPHLPDRPEWPPLERLMHEHDAVGFYLSAHPLESYAATLGGLSVTPFAQVEAEAARGITRFRLAGVVLSVKERGAAGRRYAFIQLSDQSATYEVAAFSEAYASVGDLLEPGRLVLITAAARLDGGQLKLTAQAFDDIAARAVRRMKALAVVIDEESALAPLKALLDAQEPGPGRVALVINGGARDHAVEIELAEGYALSPEVASQIHAVPGVTDVRDATRAGAA